MAMFSLLYERRVTERTEIAVTLWPELYDVLLHFLGWVLDGPLGDLVTIPVDIGVG